MTIKIEVSSLEVFEAVGEYAAAMMPPGWFEFAGIDAQDDGSFVVSLRPIPESERPKPPPAEAPAAGEVHEVSEVSKLLDRPSSLPPVGGFTNNGVLVRV